MFGSVHLLRTFLILFSLHQVLGLLLVVPWAKKLLLFDVPRKVHHYHHGYYRRLNFFKILLAVIITF
jgi:hypothetical protein